MFSPAGQPALHGGSRSTYTGRRSRTGPAVECSCRRSGSRVMSCRRPVISSLTGLELERDVQAHAVIHDLAVLDRDVETMSLANAQVTQALTGGLDRVAGR